MAKSKLLSILLILPVFLTKIVSAHCPLCTVGVGAAAAGAVWLGASKVVVALFVGAFAMSMAMWFNRLVKKKYIPFQSVILIVGIFLLTLIPLMPIVKAYGPLPIQLIGTYGSLLNRTYMLDYSLASGLFGGLIVFISPGINKKLKEKRKGIPFQGILITFALLIAAALVIQFKVV